MEDINYGEWVYCNTNQLTSLGGASPCELLDAFNCKIRIDLNNSVKKHPSINCGTKHGNAKHGILRDIKS